MRAHRHESILITAGSYDLQSPVNTELENTTPLFLREIQDYATVSLWSQHFHQSVVM